MSNRPVAAIQAQHKDTKERYEVATVWPAKFAPKDGGTAYSLKMGGKNAKGEETSAKAALGLLASDNHFITIIFRGAPGASDKVDDFDL